MSFSLFPFSVHVVKGHSMQPTLNEGQRVVVFRWAYLFSKPKKGEVVVFKGDAGKEYVKRITASANKDEFVVEGDNRGDSKGLEPVNREAVIGSVVAKY